jgi:four helix bundle protein
MSDLRDFKESMKIRTKQFAHQCVKFAIILPNNQLGNHIRGQLVRSSTSVAANYRASCIAQTVPIIISRISIAIEEADESEFWLQFAQDENIHQDYDVNTLKNEAHQLASILIKSRQTLQKK